MERAPFCGRPDRYRSPQLSLTLRIALALSLLVASASAPAQPSHYVTDEINVNLRSGAGNGYRIKERITSGTGLTVISERSGWTQVRTEAGATGWMPSQYVVAEAPAITRLPEVASELEQARERILALETRLQRVSNERDSAYERLSELKSERDQLSEQVQEASRGLQLAEENQRLKKEVVDLERRIQSLNNQVSRLSGQNHQEWFLVGAGVLGTGLLVGLLLGRVRVGRRGGGGNQL